MSDQASFTRWRSVTSRLYVAMRKSAMTAMTARTIQISKRLPFPRVRPAATDDDREDE